jgi:hypothetical protein
MDEPIDLTLKRKKRLQDRRKGMDDVNILFTSTINEIKKRLYGVDEVLKFLREKANVVSILEMKELLDQQYDLKEKLKSKEGEFAAHKQSVKNVEAELKKIDEVIKKGKTEINETNPNTNVIPFRRPQ